MDINFDCEKCGQNIVIDEAGAGLSIQCPKCNANLTVPTVDSSSPIQPVSHPSEMRQTQTQVAWRQPAPSDSQQLRAECRRLAYELRVDEAVAMEKLARDAYARERGYPVADESSGGIFFGWSGTASDLLERAEWAVKQSLRNLTAKEEKEIVGALVWQELSGRGHNDGCKEMRTVVIGSNLQWPSFEEWFRKFKAAHEWPYMWAIQEDDDEDEPESDRIEFYESELTKPTDQTLARMHGLSLAARGLLFGRRIELTADALRDGGVELAAVISELGDFARRSEPASLEKRLECLSLKSLQALQKKHGVTVQRAKKGEAPKDYFERRQRILQPLMAAVGTERLAAELPPEAVFELTQADVPRADFERFRADILVHTLSGMMATYRDYKSVAELNRDSSNRSERLRMKASLSDDCPFCLEASKRLDSVATATLEMLPPFHSGCRCIAVSEREGGEA